MQDLAKVLLQQSRSRPLTLLQPHESTPAGASDDAKSKCPYCNDDHLVRVDVPLGHPDFGKLQRCVCAVPKRTHALQELSGLSTFEQQRRLADIDIKGRRGTAQMLAACTEFCKRPRGIVTLWGPAGTGKTMALQAVVNDVVDRGVQAVYVWALDLVQTMRAALNSRQESRSEEAREMLERFEQIEVLALDDPDQVHGTPWAQKQVNALIAKRYALAESGTGGTLIAMNSDPAQQPEWIASRLLDTCNRVVHNEDPDIRRA